MSALLVNTPNSTRIGQRIIQPKTGQSQISLFLE